MRSIRERLQAMQPEAIPEAPQTDVHPEVSDVVQGIERFTEYGSHFMVDTTFPDPTDGAFSRREIVMPAGISGTKGTNGTVGHIRPDEMLFLDTETTGLERGTGTHVFLVGLGYFSGTDFRVQQYFLRDLHEEASLLSDLASMLDEFPALVTFNGRGFDWPMLMTRFILHGYRGIEEPAHWDLLTPSRRLWKHRLRDCSLGNLEQQILGIRRFGDVPGYLIPDLYFNYLRSRDARPLRPVFSHNQQDIVSLARLAEVLARADENPTASLEHPIDRVSCGLYLLSTGKAVEAEQLLLPHLNLDEISPELRFRGFKQLAEHYKRNRQLTQALKIWSRMREHRWVTAEHTLYPYVELAKYYEHREKDFVTAIRYVERAMNLASIGDWHAVRDELLHRYTRLQRRMNRLPD